MIIHNDYIVLIVNNGNCYFWNFINDYVPPFNTRYLKYNTMINFSFEKLDCLNYNYLDK